MAVKYRSQQLNIPVEYTNKRNLVEKKKLKMMMDNLIKAEPAKGLQQQFEVARSLRNTTMHPERHIYSGAMTKGYIKQSVTLFNTLFLPESKFILYQDELKKIQNSLSPFREIVLVLEVYGSRYLVNGISIEAAIQTEKEWNYLLIGYPVMLNAFVNLTNHNYIKPLSFFIKKIDISNDKVVAVNESNNEKIFIQQTYHQTDVTNYEGYLKALDTVNDKDRTMYKHNTSHEIGEFKNDFWYQKLWRMSD